MKFFIPVLTDLCSYDNGQSYRGNISVTQSGYTCQSWTSQCPHRHHRTPDNFPELNNAANACRNPGDQAPRGPWCYTTNASVRWEYCNISICPPGKVKVSIVINSTSLVFQRVRLKQRFVHFIVNVKSIMICYLVYMTSKLLFVWCLTRLPAFCMLMIIFFGLFSENATMSDWSPFTTCSASCGAGLKTRYRVCNRSRFGGKDCSALGPLSEEQPCNIHDCNGELLLS